MKEPLSRRLKERATVQVECRTPNGQGGFITGWSPVATVWAEVVGLSGEEAMKAGIERAVQQWRVTIRRRDSVTSAHQLQWHRRCGDLRLQIKSVMPDPKDPLTATLLLCESGGAG